MFKKYQRLCAIALFIIVAAVFHFSSPNIPEPDSFYYLGLGSLYRSQGIFNTELSSLPYTVIKTLSSSLWYGFGLFMLPFSFFNNPAFAIKLAGVFLTVFALTLYYLAARRHDLKFAALWPLLLLFSAPNVLFSFLMTRPQLLSFGLGILLFSFLISGGAWSVFLISSGLVWFHMNFAWLPFALLGAVIVTRLFIEKRVEWHKIAAVLGGIITGWLFRPEAINAAKLFYIQIFKLIFEKQSGLPLLFGNENLPLSIATLFKNFTPLMLLWGAAMAIFIWVLIKKIPALPAFRKTFLWSSLLLSTVFFFLTMLVARKAYGFWVGFSLLFVGAVFTYIILSLPTRHQKSIKNAALAAIMGVLLFTFFYSGYKNTISLANNALPPDKLKEAALWLKNNSDPGDIVFNLHWSDFSPLFFWNQKNYYVGGLDPIFQYSYNPELYWKFHYLSADLVAEKTCGAIACAEEMLEDTYEVLVRNFNAKYIVLTKQQNPSVNSFLESDARFEKKLDTKREAIYLIKR